MTNKDMYQYAHQVLELAVNSGNWEAVIRLEGVLYLIQRDLINELELRVSNLLDKGAA